jgi:hypothetical protein
LTAPGPAPGAQRPADDDDAWHWREAQRLRREHAGWVVIWLAPAGEYRAYGRLPGARRDTALSAGTATRMAALIGQVEQAARGATTVPEDEPAQAAP